MAIDEGCPWCGYGDTTLHPDGGEIGDDPEAQDVVVCPSCSQLTVIDKNSGPRKITDQEMTWIMANPQARSDLLTVYAALAMTGGDPVETTFLRASLEKPWRGVVFLICALLLVVAAAYPFIALEYRKRKTRQLEAERRADDDYYRSVEDDLDRRLTGEEDGNEE